MPTRIPIDPRRGGGGEGGGGEGVGGEGRDERALSHGRAFSVFVAVAVVVVPLRE